MDPITRRSVLKAASAAAVAGIVPLTTPGRAVAQTALAGIIPAGDVLFEPGLVYLNTGALGPTLRPVLEKATDYWREMERHPGAFAYTTAETLMDDVRARAGKSLNCAQDELALTKCTTEGINWAAESLNLTSGDRVLTTDQEHPGGQSGWKHLARTRGVVIDAVVIPPGERDAAGIVKRFTAAITPRTRVVMFSHVLTATGLRMPVAELCALARAHGAISIVDGAQAAGGIGVDVRALGCDVYAMSGHKWMMGPKGTGLLYIREAIAEKVDLIAREDGRKSYSASMGISNIPGVLGLGTAIDYLSGLGMKNVEAHNMGLRDALFATIDRSLPQVTLVSPPGALASPSLSFKLPDTVDATQLRLRLVDKHHIATKTVPKNWFNGLRISSHVFNSPADLDALVVALKIEVPPGRSANRES